MELTSDSRTAVLTQLLVDAFDGSSKDLRQWVQLRLGKQVHNELPEGVGLTSLAFQVALAIEKRGLGDRDFFSNLVQDRPALEAKIYAAAACWGVMDINPVSAMPNHSRLWRVPELPPHHVPRHTDIEALETWLLAIPQSPADNSVTITATGKGVGNQGLFGMGGIGKSVLAAAVCRQRAVRARCRVSFLADFAAILPQQNIAVLPNSLRMPANLTDIAG